MSLWKQGASAVVAHAEATTAEATAKAAMSTAAAAERHGAGEPHWLGRKSCDPVTTAQIEFALLDTGGKQQT
jgi:hypothetical protein